MVKSRPNNRAKGARRARRNSRKNVQGQNQKAPRRSNENDTPARGAYGQTVGDGGDVRMPLSAGGMNYGPKIIERDELVAQINGSVSFATTKFPINPGLASTFPGLSKDAALYSEWKCLSSVFYVKPLVSGFSTQGQTGETILSFDPNALGAAPTTQQQAEFFRHNQAAPYKEFQLALPAKEINRSDSKYVRAGAAPAGSDLKTYDGGNLYISTYGQGGTAACCELRHKSRFLMYAPTLLLTGSASTAGANSAFFQSTTPEAGGATTVAKQLLLATATLNGLGAVNTAGSIVPPSGVYVGNLTVMAIDTTAFMTFMTVDVKKNGTTVFTTTLFESQIPTATDSTNLVVAVPFGVSCSGTDAITTFATVSYTSGTVTLVGALTLTAT